ncbi:uncharacterized protein LOC134813758 [Bolinopsis microptera]|uniref:uncharacterized protein LOC134813758 n=1 Tax=Bolinopsis microptera TaxID=2820187 RepID=UPI003078E06F
MGDNNKSNKRASSITNMSRIPSPADKKAKSRIKNNTPGPEAKGKDVSCETIVVDSDVTPPKFDSSHRDKTKCPCSKSISSWKIDCVKCKQYWHIDCLTMNGLNQKNVNSMTNWHCPFCLVSPIPTFETDADVCYVCRNSLTLQKSNSQCETAIATEKLNTITAFGEKLAKVDFDSLNDSIAAIQNLDLHIKHLLVSDKGTAPAWVEVMEGNLKQLKTSVDSTLGKVSETDSGLTEQIKVLNKQLQDFSIPQVSAQSSSKTNDLMEKIEKNLHELNSKQSLETNQELTAIRQSLNTLERNSLASSDHLNVQLTSSSLAPGPDLIANEHLQSKEEPVVGAIEEFITTEEQKTLLLACQSLEEDFVVEGARAVYSLGEPYKYNGSKSSNGQLASTSFSNLMDKINGAFCSGEKPKINSLLINRFKEDGSLPKHSDDEATIHPESEIFTVSIGGQCNIKFFDKKTDHMALDHTCVPRSMYRMTRRSQEFYSHCIEDGAITGGVRYSLTFRSVSFRNRNSTCIIGDSHTGGLKFGLDPKKSFGQWLPGKQYFAPVVGDINPIVSCGYRNVLLMCGINDIRKPEIKNTADIKNNVFTPFVQKVEMIQALNPKANIFVCPLLPTKLVELNRKVVHYNELIFKELLHSNFGVTLVPGFDMFCDEAGLLSQQFSRNIGRNQRPDYLHLNWSGTAKLGVLIRDTILLRMNGGTDRRKKRSDKVDNRLYSQTMGGSSPAAAATQLGEGYVPYP